MNIVTTLIFVLLCITPINCAANQFYPVLRVIDGDTFIVQIAGVTDYVRIIGVDTPETKDPRKPVQCFGPEASAKAKELLLGKKIRLETDPTQQVRGCPLRALSTNHSTPIRPSLKPGPAALVTA